MRAHREKREAGGEVYLMLRKLAKWFGISIAVLVVIATCVFAGYAHTNRPKKIVKFLDISLGSSMDEVAYSLGAPDSVLETSDSDKRFLIEVSKEDIAKTKRTYKDYPMWAYNGPNLRIDVSFDPATKTVIEIGCYTSKNQRLSRGSCDVNGIYAGMAEDQVIDRLGPPSHSSIDQLVKHLEYVNFNMAVYLEQREAYYIIVRELK